MYPLVINITQVDISNQYKGIGGFKAMKRTAPTDLKSIEREQGLLNEELSN